MGTAGGAAPPSALDPGSLGPGAGSLGPWWRWGRRGRWGRRDRWGRRCVGRRCGGRHGPVPPAVPAAASPRPQRPAPADRALRPPATRSGPRRRSSQAGTQRGRCCGGCAARGGAAGSATSRRPRGDSRISARSMRCSPAWSPGGFRLRPYPAPGAPRDGFRLRPHPVLRALRDDFSGCAALGAAGAAGRLCAPGDVSAPRRLPLARDGAGAAPRPVRPARSPAKPSSNSNPPCRRCGLRRPGCRRC